MVRLNKKRIKWVIIILFAILLIAISVSVIIVSQKVLPTNDLRLAREALTMAKEAEANIYSEKVYKESVQMYDSAMVNWSKENARFILFRNYSRVINFAKQSKKKAENAKDESVKKSDLLSKDVEAAFVSMEKK